MYEQITKETDANLSAFIENVEDLSQRNDCVTLVNLISEITQNPAKLWGTSIIGYGRYHYKYDSGHEGDAPLISFSPRKGKFVFYLTGGLENLNDLSAPLGKHKTGKGCLYINKLSDINLSVLKEIIEKSFKIQPAYSTQQQ